MCNRIFPTTFLAAALIAVPSLAGCTTARTAASDDAQRPQDEYAQLRYEVFSGEVALPREKAAESSADVQQARTQSDRDEVRASGD